MIGAMNSRPRLGRSRRTSAVDPPDERPQPPRAHAAASPSPANCRKAASRSSVPASARSCRAGAAGDDLARADEQQVVAPVGLVHHVARHDDRRPAVGERPEVAPELDAQQRVDADGGLVEEQHLGAMDQRAGERQAPALAAGERPGDASCGGPRARRGRARRSTARLRVGAVGLGEEPRVLADRQGRVDAVAPGSCSRSARASAATASAPRAPPRSRWSGGSCPSAAG